MFKPKISLNAKIKSSYYIICSKDLDTISCKSIQSHQCNFTLLSKTTQDNIFSNNKQTTYETITFMQQEKFHKMCSPSVITHESVNQPTNFQTEHEFLNINIFPSIIKILFCMVHCYVVFFDVLFSQHSWERIHLIF